MGVARAERLSDDLSQDWQQQVCSRLQVRLLATQDFLRSKGGQDSGSRQQNGEGRGSRKGQKNTGNISFGVHTHAFYGAFFSESQS